MRTPFAELDLVLQDGGELLCVEVKTTRAARDQRWRPSDRLRPADLRRQHRAAAWLVTRIARVGRARLALCEVFLSPGGDRPRILLEPLDPTRSPGPAGGFHPGRSRGR